MKYVSVKPEAFGQQRNNGFALTQQKSMVQPVDLELYVAAQKLPLDCLPLQGKVQGNRCCLHTGNPLVADYADCLERLPLNCVWNSALSALKVPSTHKWGSQDSPMVRMLKAVLRNESNKEVTE